ncbi:TadE/TadG family type IV pilus assembly protein [Orrella dioscoreae]|uniref:TadE/TadG family type IV pilus assembly protein n=1 Tax=Orrella dioscoreae TaxID=1851544 RepID=UPI0009F70ED8|nr:TadE family protein [Orrella dioscoreae]
MVLGDGTGVKGGQRGAYAVEFGLVFLAFFFVLYAVLTYGLIFTAQQALNIAAQDGARGALRWQQGDAAMVQRARLAHALALDHAKWIRDMAGQEGVRIAVCGNAGLLAGEGACGADLPARDEIEVRVSYAYRQAPLVPDISLGLMGALFLPEQLAAQAKVRLGADVMPVEGAT